VRRSLVDFTTALAGSRAEHVAGKCWLTYRRWNPRCADLSKTRRTHCACLDFNVAVQLQFRKAKSISVLRRHSELAIAAMDDWIAQAA
jgi:hypothetical protein